MMQNKSEKEDWKSYCEQQLNEVTPIIEKLGYTLDNTQPHIGGERFLMQAVTTTSGRKIILLGSNSNGKKLSSKQHMTLLA